MTKEETVKWLESLKSEIGKSEHRSLWHYAKSIDMAIEALSADAVHGEWIKVEEQPYFRKHYDTVCCSVCRKKGNRKWNYCPNCGARMTPYKGGDDK